MAQITLDAELAGRLRAHGGVVDVRDSDGNYLGKFVPLVDLNQWVPITADVTADELDRRARSTDWVTADDVEKHFRSLGEGR